MAFSPYTLLFDIDGTLIDSAPGILRSVQYSLEQMGREVPEAAALTCFIGPPLVDSYQNYCGMTEADAHRATALYRERYHDVGVHEAAPYAGVPALLEDLKTAGFFLAVATSKPQALAERFLALHGLAAYFSVICGAVDGVRMHKPEILAYLLPLLPAGGQDAVMIGDRRYDIEGAKRAGLRSVGVRYGFSDPGELEAAGADWVVDTVGELRRLLLETEADA